MNCLWTTDGHRAATIKLGISDEPMGHITDVPKYWKVYSRWVPHILMAKRKCQELTFVSICTRMKVKNFFTASHEEMTAVGTWLHH